jgi:hypothetical protein
MTLILTEDLCRVLYNQKYHYHSEKDLQRGIGQVLSGLGVVYTPEVPLSPHDRIDFLIEGGVGIECKVGGSLNALIRQLGRYAASGKVRELVVVTTRSSHCHLPNQILGVNLFVVVLNVFL